MGSPLPTLQDAVIKGTALAGLSAALLSAGSAEAAMEVANIAAGDNRFGTIAFLAVPALGVSPCWQQRKLLRRTSAHAAPTCKQSPARTLLRLFVLQ